VAKGDCTLGQAEGDRALTESLPHTHTVHTKDWPVAKETKVQRVTPPHALMAVSCTRSHTHTWTKAVSSSSVKSNSVNGPGARVAPTFPLLPATPGPAGTPPCPVTGVFVGANGPSMVVSVVGSTALPGGRIGGTSAGSGRELGSGRAVPGQPLNKARMPIQRYNRPNIMQCA
jgi:hypothetical protein